jgi:PAT family beta-lactamase induction signal transducer AmpG
MASQQTKGFHPALWVPTLYIAEGLPFVATSIVAALMYKSLGLPDSKIAAFTSIIGLTWTLKPLWSPFMEMYRTKKFFVVTTQFLGGLSFALLAMSLSSEAFVRYSLAFFALIAFNSATHDIAADGLYIESLSKENQARFVGVQGACWNIGKILAQGALVSVAGVLEVKLGPQAGWGIVMGIFASILILFSIYHRIVLPSGKPGVRVGTTNDTLREFWHVTVTFFKKKHVFWGIAFILLYRFAEGQAQKIFPLFLRADRAHGGLGLSTGDVGIGYGWVGPLPFIFGSILGGYFASKLTLRRALLPLCAMFNLPYAAYLFLAWFQPDSLTVVAGAIAVEMFGYGFGFVAVTLFMMQQMATGPYKMAHYAVATGVMNLGMMLPGFWSGYLSDAIGYKNFFIWVMASTVASFTVAVFVPFKNEEEVAAENNEAPQLAPETT